MKKKISDVLNAKPNELKVPNEDKKLVEQIILEATVFGKELEDYESFEEFLNAMNAVGAKTIKKKMESRDYPEYLFPSSWRGKSDLPKSWKGKGEYPKILAEALVMSKESESLTDYANTFYAGTLLSKSAMDVFKKDALKNGGFNAGYSLRDLVSDVDAVLADGNIGDMVNEDPKFSKKYLMTNAGDEIMADLASNKANAAAFKKMGLDPEDYLD